MILDHKKNRRFLDAFYRIYITHCLIINFMLPEISTIPANNPLKLKK